jgi:hypothetical protein
VRCANRAAVLSRWSAQRAAALRALGG